MTVPKLALYQAEGSSAECNVCVPYIGLCWHPTRAALGAYVRLLRDKPGHCSYPKDSIVQLES